MSQLKICQLDDIRDGDARGFEIAVADQLLPIICIRHGHKLIAYKNSCPHTGVNLEWLPDQFLDDTRQFLVCSTHGALFQVEDGRCVAGPCAGDSLERITLQQKDGEYFIEGSNEEVHG